jgi:hypothetical protein
MAPTAASRRANDVDRLARSWSTPRFRRAAPRVRGLVAQPFAVPRRQYLVTGRGGSQILPDDWFPNKMSNLAGMMGSFSLSALR